MKRIMFTLFAALALTFGTMDLSWAQGRPGHAGGGGGQAAPRSGGGGGQAAAPRGGGHATAPAPQGTARSRGDSSGVGSSTQGSARPRGTGGPVYAQAVPRGSVPGSRIIVPYRYYGLSPWFYYSPYAYGAFGFGFWGYDPYWWGGWGYPYGYGWGYPYYGYGWGGYGYNYGYYDRSYEGSQRDYGSLRLKVKPKEAEVYADGYYMGQVDDFDGTFKHLDLQDGTHRIEIRANGYDPLVFEMRIEPGRTVTYENRLRPAQGPR